MPEDDGPEEVTERKSPKEQEEIRGTFLDSSDQIKARATGAETSRNWWMLIAAILALLLLVLGSCSVLGAANRSAEMRDLRYAASTRPTVTVTAKSKPAATVTQEVVIGADGKTRPAGGSTAAATTKDYTRPKKPGDGDLFYRTMFKTCALLNIVYSHGVGDERATEQPAAGDDRVDNWSKDTSGYWANEYLDDDKDGVACERGNR